MVVGASTSGASPPRSALWRGAAFFAGLGALLGGLVGTLQWPVVATFVGATAAAVVGAVVGVLAGAVLAAVAGRTRSRWAARGASAVIAGAATVTVVLVETAPFAMPGAGAIGVVTAATLLGGGLGPLIAFGPEATMAGRRAGTAVGPVLRRILGWGAAAGAGLGAVAGLVVGIWANLPTAPFALVEGAILGGVNGLLLAVLAAAAVLLPRVRARR